MQLLREEWALKEGGGGPCAMFSLCRGPQRGGGLSQFHLLLQDTEYLILKGQIAATFQFCSGKFGLIGPLKNGFVLILNYRTLKKLLVELHISIKLQLLNYHLERLKCTKNLILPLSPSRAGLKPWLL